MSATDRATVPVMETGTMRQELDVWARTTVPTQRRQVYRCPWPGCCWHTADRANLHDHLDIIHGGNAPT